MTATVNAPEAPIRQMFDDPTAEAVVWETNGTYDDLRPGKHDGFPLADEQVAKLPGEDAQNVGLPDGEVCASFGASGQLGDTHVFIVTVEFYYRNDASRSAWGSGLSPETNIKSTLESQTPALKLAFSRAYPRLAEIGGDASMTFRAYVQPDGSSTDDRHILYLYIPVDHVMDNDIEIVQFVRDLIQGTPA